MFSFHPPILPRPPDAGEVVVPAPNGFEFGGRSLLVVRMPLLLLDAGRTQNVGIEPAHLPHAELTTAPITFLCRKESVHFLFSWLVVTRPG